MGMGGTAGTGVRQIGARALRAGLSAGMGLWLAACGGGGGGDAGGTSTAPPPAADGVVASASVEALCAAPRPSSARDLDGQPYPDRQGTLRNELDWVRAWIDETYLWYRDVRDLSAATRNAANYSNPVAYFDALKSPALTASGRPRDIFHFTYDTAAWEALSRSGAGYGYDMTIVFSGWDKPRKAVVAFVRPGGAAAQAGITRGREIVAVDGVDLVRGDDEWTLYKGLFPTAAAGHLLQLRDPATNTTQTVTLQAALRSGLPVPGVKTLPAPHQAVGYLQFDEHAATAENALVDAFSQLAAAGVTDLVLDIRYNGGGYLDVASEVAYMIAGPARTSGKVFERLMFNDRNPFGLSEAQRSTPFHTRTRGLAGVPTQALPTLNLGRVYVLTTGDTCSASEAIINGLRGVGVEVVQVGGTTCGKPYGFYPADNCGTTYFAIQFEGVNALGNGGYADGMAPTCSVSDDFAHALGDPSEGLLATALTVRATGSCPSAADHKSPAGVRSEPTLRVLRSPLLENRWLANPARRGGA